MEDKEFKRSKLVKESTTNVWWRDSLFFFFDLSGYILGPLIAAYLIGSFIDKKFDSSPWGITLALGTGFIVSIGMIVFKTIKYMKSVETVLNAKKQDTKEATKEDAQ